jgi:hypothetical protein
MAVWMRNWYPRIVLNGVAVIPGLALFSCPELHPILFPRMTICPGFKSHACKLRPEGYAPRRTTENPIGPSKFSHNERCPDPGTLNPGGVCGTADVRRPAPKRDSFWKPASQPAVVTFREPVDMTRSGTNR